MPAARELTVLTTLAQALSRPADLADSLDAALATVADVLGLETGWVWLLDEASGEPRLAAARALPAALRTHPEAMRGDCYCLKRFREGDLGEAANISVVRCSRLAMLEEEADAANGLRCHTSVPLAVGARRLGMLNVAARDWRTLSEDELNLLTTLGALVSLVVERSRLDMESARAAAAEERNRLAREIHDTLAQALAALTMQLEAADAMSSAAGHTALASAVTRALGLARDALDEARNSVLDLRASPLDGRTLPQALRDLAADAERAGWHTLRIDVRLDGFARGSPELPIALEIGLYRIAQQALANVQQHAHAHHATMRLARDGACVRLRIEDDGRGFEPDRVPPHRFGLVGMGERARLLGGRMLIETSPGSGTAVDIEVPIRAATRPTRPDA